MSFLFLKNTTQEAMVSFQCILGLSRVGNRVVTDYTMLGSESNYALAAAIMSRYSSIARCGGM